MTESTSQELERQIAELQRQLQSARGEGGDADAPYERQEVREAVGEQIKQQMPSYAPSVSAQPPVVGFGSAPSYQDPALASQVQQLVNIAFTRSVREAIADAVKSGNPALVDALHDVLTDQLYGELVKRQKISPAA